MIRINLLPHKKKSSSSTPVEGEKTVGIGMGILIAVVAGLFFFVHTPLQDDFDAQERSNAKLKAENTNINQRTKDFKDLKAAFQAAQVQAAAITSLNDARATPANFLYELSSILKPNTRPTMTASMAKDVEDNENLRWQKGWDPQHVWIDSIKEKEGEFTLIGSALSDGDVTQLAHRLAASAYFDRVQPEGSVKKSGKAGSITIYTFRITGQVRY
ncbi:MAG: PilN domain-containing protein [Myxococcales bacterium]|nr:PilN domain-containing protein [Myxococcales bacterium]